MIAFYRQPSSSGLISSVDTQSAERKMFDSYKAEEIRRFPELERPLSLREMQNFFDHKSQMYEALLHLTNDPVRRKIYQNLYNSCSEKLEELRQRTD